MNRSVLAALAALSLASLCGCDANPLPIQKTNAEAGMRGFLESQFPGRVIGVSCTVVGMRVDTFAPCTGTVRVQTRTRIGSDDRTETNDRVVSASCSTLASGGCKWSDDSINANGVNRY